MWTTERYTSSWDDWPSKVYLTQSQKEPRNSGSRYVDSKVYT